MARALPPVQSRKALDERDTRTGASLRTSRWRVLLGQQGPQMSGAPWNAGLDRRGLQEDRGAQSRAVRGAVVSLIESQERGITDYSPRARRYATVNPTTGEHLRDYPSATLAELDQLVEAAHQGFLAWRRWSVSERAGVLQRAGELMLERQEELGGSDPLIILDLDAGRRPGGDRGSRC